MPNGPQHVGDLISAPMEAVIAALGSGIARAQRSLDRLAIDSMREIAEDPVLSEFGIQVNAYQIPRAELDMTIAVAFEQRPARQVTAAPGTTTALLQAAGLRSIHFQPVNAAYTNRFAFDVQATSHLKLTVVPVPPASAEGIVAPRLSRDDVLAAAQPTIQRATGSTEVPADARLAVNFNAQGRLWVVLLYRLTNDVANRMALVVVDDDTGTVVKADPSA